jgi:hypothetical protein
MNTPSSVLLFFKSMDAANCSLLRLFKVDLCIRSMDIHASLLSIERWSGIYCCGQSVYEEDWSCLHFNQEMRTYIFKKVIKDQTRCDKLCAQDVIEIIYNIVLFTSLQQLACGVYFYFLLAFCCKYYSIMKRRSATKSTALPPNKRTSNRVRGAPGRCTDQDVIVPPICKKKRTPKPHNPPHNKEIEEEVSMSDFRALLQTMNHFLEKLTPSTLQPPPAAPVEDQLTKNIKLVPFKHSFKNVKGDGYDSLNTLISHSRCKTPTKFGELVKKFFQESPWESDAKAADYLTSMKQLREKINNFHTPPKECIPDRLFIAHIVNQLPPKYDQYRVQLHKITTIPDLVDNVKCYAKSFEKQDAEKNTTPPVAFNMNNSNQNPNQKQNPFRRQPLRKLGFNPRNKRRRQQLQRRQRPPPFPKNPRRQPYPQQPSCTYCGRYSHTEKECRVKTYQMSRGIQPAKAHNTTAQFAAAL